tara:strand:+ start:1211 stop:1933 length:723 start_codon:yes stop_codon:yes gene_type:complete
MKISINQPAYLPWLGYFERIDSSDIHVILNHVQYEKNSYINRNKIYANQKVLWLTIPVSKALGTLDNNSIKNVVTQNNKKWIRTHLKTIYYNYCKSPFFDQYYPDFKRLLENQINEKCFFNIINSINNLFLKYLNIKTQIIYSNNLGIDSKKSDLVLDICKSQNAKQYLSGENGIDYLNLDDFEKSNINVFFQKYNHPVYNQYRKKFISHLSILDLLFFHGKESLNIIRKGKNYIRYDKF